MGKRFQYFTIKYNISWCFSPVVWLVVFQHTLYQINEVYLYSQFIKIFKQEWIFSLGTGGSHL
jgi:hypothetical protein